MTALNKNNARILLALLLGFALYQAFSGDFLSYLNYFTNTGNLAIFVVLVGVITKRFDEKHLFFAGLISLVINIVYIVLLVDDYDVISDIVDSEWQWTVLHYVIPYALLIDLYFLPSSWAPTFKRLLSYLWFPILYVTYAMIYGAITQDYAYFFFDLNEMGFQVPLYILGIFAFYFILGTLFKSLKSLQNRG
jgi:hypothetical protein